MIFIGKASHQWLDNIVSHGLGLLCSDRVIYTNSTQTAISLFKTNPSHFKYPQTKKEQESTAMYMRLETQKPPNAAWYKFEDLSPTCGRKWDLQ